MTVHGSGFQIGATVTFAGTAATNVTVTSSFALTAIAPAHPQGAADVVVANPDGQKRGLARAYTYFDPFDACAGCWDYDRVPLNP